MANQTQSTRRPVTEIRIQDTLARSLVGLDTRDDGRVAMYVCGPTVYNYIHIGNARTFVWFDLIRRYLRYRGFEVTYVMNYTDVDDKIIERANLEGIPVDAITSKYSKAFEEDLSALGARPADVVVRATEHIDDMVKAIEGLIEKGIAYEADGNVFFSVESFPSYGKLSGRSLDDMRAGEGIEAHESKRSPLDFALWKAAKPGEPEWPSPWGPGRPGWHIECSVMSTRYLGMGFDIHGGGTDLIFPHHENEIAQAEALEDGRQFVRHWLHAGMVQMESEKMSKSLGNVVTAHDALERYPAEALRYWMLTGSYRSQVTFSEDSIADAVAAYERWKTFKDVAVHAIARDQTGSQPESGDYAEETGLLDRFVASMDDDFNSAEALAAIHEIVSTGNRYVEDAQRGDPAAVMQLLKVCEMFDQATGVLGFAFPSADTSALAGSLIDYLLELREDARAEKAFDRADSIRERLVALGVAVEDTPAGTRWRTGG
jgi:cysteinyl-tRNA synthetase